METVQSLGLPARVIDAFLAECMPAGGIDARRSPWQVAGRGAAVGGTMFPGGVDVRYVRYSVEAFYRLADLTGEERYAYTADAQARFLARCVREGHPSWAYGTGLEAVGLFHARHAAGTELLDEAARIVSWARSRKVLIVTRDNVAYSHFPCGYGVLEALDAGWTNDLSILGSGLVRAAESLGDPAVLRDAASFAEFFLQPWRRDALGPDGFWQCGTWREDLSSWVVGPSDYSGFESTDARADDVSWIFSALTCTDFLCRLHALTGEARCLARCRDALAWSLGTARFEDGAVGICGRDDKWLGAAGAAISQVKAASGAMCRDRVSARALAERAAPTVRYLLSRLPSAKLEEHGVEWVRRATSTDPLVNVAMLWLFAVMGALDARELDVAP
jgi:hypothetical protein